jgi:glycine cleavage system H lipoate-binding protein
MKSMIEASGHFHVECVNPDGSIAWVDDIHNMATTVGLNHMLSTELGAGTQVTAWYLGLISNTGFSALAAGDTMAAHAGWVENQSYAEAARPTWTPGTAASGSITNPSVIAFTINASGQSIYGFFLTSVSTKGGTTGTLFSTGALSAVQSPVNGQVLNVTYTITLTATTP